MRGLAALLSAIMLTACATQRAPALTISERNWVGLSLEQKQISLDQLSAACGLRPNTLRALGGDNVAVQPEPSSSFTSVDCLLKKLEPLGSFVKLGFIGNEAFSEEKK